MRPRIPLIAGAALLALSACSAHSPDATQAKVPDPPALGPTPVITDPGQITLPTDSYLPTAAKVSQIQQAKDAVTAQCMRKFGFTFRGTLVMDLATSPGRSPREQSTVYGDFDVAGVKVHGYNRNIDGAAAMNQEMALRGESSAQQEPVTPEYQQALTGNDPNTRQPVKSVAGQPVPAGGCSAAGNAALGNLAVGTTTTVLPDGGPVVPRTDARLVAAFAKWSACMKSKGYNYPDPIAAISDKKWNPAGGRNEAVPVASPEEIAVATADVRCKLDNNTVGVAVAVQTVYAKQYIESHVTQLAAFQKQLDDTLAKAAQLIAGGAGS
ncbi:hypothetical protein ACFXKJ_26110 [Kitasatospora indigofera]|uniref:hypothetical protein n=1 Tax=Kitasatospora indigofera TaxID=67307 RepID=UPI003629FE4D